MHIHVYTVVLHHEKHYMSVNTKKYIYICGFKLALNINISQMN